MIKHLSLGALVKESNDYIYPAKAIKKVLYSCPKCNKDVQAKKGNIRVHHFAHLKSDSPCEYYNNPGESEIHKEAKQVLKSVLDERRNIIIMRKCFICKNTIKREDIAFKDSYKALIEYSFFFNDSNKKADVALIDIDDKIVYIFEILNKHQTLEENRPEPWFEINAIDLINYINSKENIDTLNIFCVRKYRCEKCIRYEKENEIRQILEEERRLAEIKIEEEEKERRVKYEEMRVKYEEMIKKKIEEEIREKIEEKKKIKKEKMLIISCHCGLERSRICKCKDSTYNYNKMYDLYKCEICLNWKDRCISLKHG